MKQPKKENFFKVKENKEQKEKQRMRKETSVKKLNMQKEILLSLIQGKDGEAWARDRVGWSYDSEYEVCYWDGIDCDPDEHDGVAVTGIFLPGINLKGTVPSELGDLTTLKELTLPKNELTGTIPIDLANLDKIKIINLGDNKLTGTIPIFKSKKLNEIMLNGNKFTGTIPLQTGDKLNDYDICENQLIGTIPSTLATMIKLRALSLSENDLSGTIPSFLGDLKSLHFLFMDHNNFVGTIPPSLTRINSELEEVWLHENQLSGTVPAAVADVKPLFNFYIDGNKITGTIPGEVCKKKLNQDFFTNVNINDIDRDYCEAVACPIGTISKEGMYPCIKCHDQYSNPYLGRQGSCIDLKPIDILKIFYDSTNGYYWDMEHTNKGEAWFTDFNDKDANASDLSNIDERSICAWIGIDCDNDNNVISIQLSNFGLSGKIPEEIGYLRFLSILDLSDNELSGYIPSDLRWAPLNKLDVSGNKLKGLVPPTLCEKEGINSNGQTGRFDCEYIACPMGYFSPTTGRLTEDDSCIPCKYGTSYLGSKECYVTKNSNKMHSTNNNYGNDLSSSFHEGGSKLVIDVLGLMAGLAIIGFFFSYRDIKSYIKERTGSTQRVVQYEYGANLNMDDDSEGDDDDDNNMTFDDYNYDIKVENNDDNNNTNNAAHSFL